MKIVASGVVDFNVNWGTSEEKMPDKNEEYLISVDGTAAPGYHGSYTGPTFQLKRTRNGVWLFRLTEQGNSMYNETDVTEAIRNASHIERECSG
jgi:hypothetical protein